MGLTRAGVNLIAQALTGTSVPFNAETARIGVGDGQAAFSIEHQDLTGANKFRKKVEAGYPIVDPPDITFKAIFGPDEANFAWNEWGIFNAETGGTMLDRVVESNGTKQANQTWILEVTVSLGVVSFLEE